MKIFIVNIRDCLPLSQYEPFFYEHIYNNDLTLLDGLGDTSQLDAAYEQILAQLNRQPFSFREAAVFVFIPRDFSAVGPRDFELYNDINTYTHLSVKLPRSFRVINFYVDKTGELELSDAEYLRLRKPSETLSATEAFLKEYFPQLPTEPRAEDYKAVLAALIADLHPTTSGFFRSVLDTMPELEAAPINFQNGINNYISECKERFLPIGHFYEPLVKDDISTDIKSRLKVVYYIKSLIRNEVKVKEIPDYSTFPDPDYEHIQRLLCTYRQRLSLWYGDPSPLSTTGRYTEKKFHSSLSIRAQYEAELNKIIKTELDSMKPDSAGKLDLIDGVFDKLDRIVQEAKERLGIHAETLSRELFIPSNYIEGNETEFDLTVPDTQDRLDENELLGRMNKHGAGALPGYAEENKLDQELDIINHVIQQILDKLNALKAKLFITAYISAFVVVAALYFASQFSVITSLGAWALFGFYCLGVAAAFSTAYFFVKRKYVRQIDSLLVDARNRVSDYLKAYKELASLLEENMRTCAEYRCAKDALEQRQKARAQYLLDLNRYNWHRAKVADILKNLDFFAYFIGDATPYSEEVIPFDSYEHDAVHTKFYQLRVF